MLEGINKSNVNTEKYKEQGTGALQTINLTSPTYPTEVQARQKEIDVVREEAKGSEE